MSASSSHPSTLRLAIAAGAPSPQLAALLALQRAEEPETIVLVQEVASGDLARGFEDGSFDTGIALSAAATIPDLNSQQLWVDELALAVPLRSPLLGYAKVSLEALLHYPMFRWCLQACDALSRQVDAVFEPEERPIQEIASFELMTVLVAAGYGVGIAPRSRIVQARGWGVAMRPLANGPYLISTQLLRPSHGSPPAVERFAERATTVAETFPVLPGDCRPIM